MAEPKKTIRIVPKRIILIIIIVAVVALFGRMKSFAGGLIGQAAEDGSMIFDGAADITTEGEEAVLESGETVFIPAANELHFDSEDVMQQLNLGNPADNTRLMKMIMMMDETQIFETGILRPGKGIAEGKVEAIFEPNTYDTTMIYIFYEEPANKIGKLKEIGRVEKSVKLISEGSGERYRENVARSRKNKK